LWDLKDAKLWKGQRLIYLIAAYHDFSFILNRKIWYPSDLFFLFFFLFLNSDLMWFEVWMMITQVKYSYPCLIPSKGCWDYYNLTRFFCPSFLTLYYYIILLVDLGLWWPDGCRKGKYMPDLLIFSWTRTVWGWITMHVLCCTFACWYCCLFYYFKKKIVAFVVGWTNLNEMAVMTWKYSSWTDQKLTWVSLPRKAKPLENRFEIAKFLVFEFRFFKFSD